VVKYLRALVLCYEMVNLYCIVYVVLTPTRSGILSLIYQLHIYYLTMTHQWYHSMTASNKDVIQKLKAEL
jgi:hypothetical protein